MMLIRSITIIDKDYLKQRFNKSFKVDQNLCVFITMYIRVNNYRFMNYLLFLPLNTIARLNPSF